MPASTTLHYYILRSISCISGCCKLADDVADILHKLADDVANMCQLASLCGIIIYVPYPTKVVSPTGCNVADMLRKLADDVAKF